MTNRNEESMIYKLKLAKSLDTLARTSELIRLEALCRIADALETIAEANRTEQTEPEER